MPFSRLTTGLEGWLLTLAVLFFFDGWSSSARHFLSQGGHAAGAVGLSFMYRFMRHRRDPCKENIAGLGGPSLFARIDVTLFLNQQTVFGSPLLLQLNEHALRDSSILLVSVLFCHVLLLIAHEEVLQLSLNGLTVDPSVIYRVASGCRDLAGPTAEPKPHLGFLRLSYLCIFRESRQR